MRELPYWHACQHTARASSVWDTHLIEYVKQLEGVQKRAARFVKSCHEREPGKVTSVLNELRCMEIVERKLKSLTFNIISQGKAVYDNRGLSPITSSDVETPTKTSSLSYFLMMRQIALATSIEPLPSIHSSIHLSIHPREWNALPNQIVSIHL